MVLRFDAADVPTDAHKGVLDPGLLPDLLMPWERDLGAPEPNIHEAGVLTGAGSICGDTTGPAGAIARGSAVNVLKRSLAVAG